MLLLESAFSDRTLEESTAVGVDIIYHKHIGKNSFFHISISFSSMATYPVEAGAR
jgi:hypothetical protein